MNTSEPSKTGKLRRQECGQIANSKELGVVTSCLSITYLMCHASRLNLTRRQSNRSLVQRGGNNYPVEKG